MADYEREASPMDTFEGKEKPRDRSPSRSRSRSRSVKREERSRSRSHSRQRSPPARGSSRRRSPEPRRRSGYRSRSRSRSRDHRRKSISPRRRSRSPPRRRSRSPVRRPINRDNGRNKEFHGTRDEPEKSKIVGVFGLSLRTREVDLEEVFGKYGPIEKATIVYDHRSNRSRGFGFVYFEEQKDATNARDALNGESIDDRKIRVDYSMTHRPHTPTPGEYMGERKRDDRDRDRGSRHYGDRRSGPRSPRRRSYRSRSRSRSWSR